MEFFWTIPLFALPILTVLSAVKGIRNYQISKQKKYLKKPILFFALTIVYTMLVLYIGAETTKHYQQSLVGSYSQSDPSRTHLQLLENHRFILEDKIKAEYNGIGHWQINLDSDVLLILKFDNGENMDFIFSPVENLLFSKTESLKNLTLHKED